MYKVYCDFDATVTVNDVWDVLFKRFGTPEANAIWQKFNTRELTAAECIRFACSTVKNADKEEALLLFLSQPLRPGFLEFYEFCRSKEIEITIVSDGFSAYIRPIFEKYGISLPYYANDVEVTDEGTLSVELKNSRESCWRCGACKCGAIVTTSADTDTIVYIGDGYSDHCPVEIADIVFARDMLASFCSRHSIAHHEFEDFYTIQTQLEKYMVERPKYKRDTAHKNRQKLVIAE
jgi:2-hydroxy-3-keto-5-methylthiopentenyl-1-phosphate phosphatase